MEHAEQPAGTDARTAQLGLLAAILGSSIVFLDSTVVNVALPAIQHDLGGGLAAQQWVVDAYLLTLGSLILVGGSLGDLFGAVRVFSLGVAAFAVASVVCAIAPDPTLLIVFRGVQGVAGALLTPASLALITTLFTGRERGAAIGSWTAWSGISFVVGPLLGGWLIGVWSWRAIFLLNVPVALATLAIVSSRCRAARRTDERVRIDLVGRGALRDGPRRPRLRPHRAAAARLGRRRLAPRSRRRGAARGLRRLRAARAGSRCCRCGSSRGGTSRSRTSRRSRSTAASRPGASS